MPIMNPPVFVCMSQQILSHRFRQILTTNGILSIMYHCTWGLEHAHERVRQPGHEAGRPCEWEQQPSQGLHTLCQQRVGTTKKQQLRLSQEQGEHSQKTIYRPAEVQQKTESPYYPYINYIRRSKRLSYKYILTSISALQRSLNPY